MEQMEYEEIMFDDFINESLNEDYWFEFYLPQWSNRVLSRPSYIIENSVLKLFIRDNQKPWCPKWNGNVKVSNLQTGVFSGPLGSSLGQHHFTDNLIVQEEQKKEIKVSLHYGIVEFKARCRIGSDNVAALWLIGIEEKVEESAEICLFELKGTNVQKTKSVIGYGVHPFNDPYVKDCFYEESFEIDVADWNVYAFDWYPTGIDFYINGKLIKRVSESPNYPMQLMLNFYDIGCSNNNHTFFEIDYIKVAKNLTYGG